MSRQLINISLKQVLAGVIALILGYLLDLQFFTTASAGAILSIQLTKRDFIQIGIKRLISSFFAITLGAVMFKYLGQTFLYFSLFLIIFVLFSWIFKMPEGIVLGVVFVTHFYVIDNITLNFYLEELLVLLLSLGVAFLVNMFYPELSKNRMYENMHKVDDLVEEYILAIVNDFSSNSINKLENYRDTLNKIMNEAQMVDKNIIVQNDHRYMTYLYMRNLQISTLSDIYNNLRKIKHNHEYTKMILDYLKEISNNIGFSNNAEKCLITYNELSSYFINSSLPKTREEFETRARLFVILNEIESFLNLKIEFHQKYPNFS